MRKSYNTAERNSESLEATRRLYRGATDLAKRLDEQRSCALTTADIFTPSGEVLRAKLKDYCERLILKDPVNHARKIEELLWRRGFYDAVAASKKLRKGNVWSNEEKALVSTHLLVGVGFYHHLILRLQQECGLELSGVVDFAFPRRNNVLSTREKLTPSKLQSEEARQCAIKIIHRSLICLGDLARYKLEIEPNWDPMIATRYYKMAIAIDPNIGMPHNQLGTLAGNKNYGINAVYHYLRCILCSEPFEGTEGNIKRVIANHFHSGKEKLPSQICATRLFSLLQKWDNNSSSIDKINEDCENLLTEIEKCLTMKKVSPLTLKTRKEEDSIDEFLQNSKTEQLAYLTDDVVFKIVAICLMSISKLQSKESSHVQSVIAFVLSLLSKLIQITTVQLQESIIDFSLLNGEDFDVNFIDEKIPTEIGMVTPPKIDDLMIDDNKKSQKCTNEAKKNGNVNGKIKKSREKKSLLSKLRRPRKRMNSSDSDGSEIDEHASESSSDDLNSDISESDGDDFMSDDNDGFDDISEDDEENDDQNRIKKERIVENGHKLDNNHDHDDHDGEKLKLKVMSVEGNEKKTQKTPEHAKNLANGGLDRQDANLSLIAQIKKQRLNPNDLLDTLSKIGLFQSIKICFDWIKSHPEMIKIISKSSRILLQRISILLNLLTLDKSSFFGEFKKESGLLSNSEKFDDYVKVLPLPEDTDLKGLDVLKNSHDKLDWKILQIFRINKFEETLLRTQKLIDFGDYLTTIGDTGMKFDENTKLYTVTVAEEVVTIKEEVKNKNENNKNEKDEDSDQSRGKLMRHMGKLWLKAEVRALESSLRSKLMSAYLVPDQNALAKYTPFLKRLMYSKKFIIVIPSVVVSALDEVKRTSGKAREATRWLETQLRKGSRFLRAQRPHERLALPYIKGPKPKDKEAWLYFQIIEFCNYLTQQSKVGLSSNAEPPVVTLLTGMSSDDRKASTFSYDGLAKTTGDFIKCRNVNKSFHHLGNKGANQFGAHRVISHKMENIKQEPRLKILHLRVIKCSGYK